MIPRMAQPVYPEVRRGEEKTRLKFRCPNCRREVAVVAVPVAGRPRRCQLRLVQPLGPQAAGDPLGRCPGCGRDLPSLTWGEFEDLLGASAW
jgi:hypothetical protein